VKLTFNFYLDKIMNPGTLFYASKHACNLFLIEIRLRNYRRRIDKDILFFKILKEQPNFECIVSYCLQEGSKTNFRSGIEYKILIDTSHTSKKLWRAKKIYNIINGVLRKIVGVEQPLTNEYQSSTLQNIADIDRCPEILIKKAKSMEHAIQWATNIDYEPRFTKSFNINYFHESHAIRKWALENINEKTSVAIEKAKSIGFRRSLGFLRDYLDEKKAYYKNIN
jgi:hypothetical protein